MLQSAKCGAIQYSSTTFRVQCAVTDENQTFETHVGSRVGCISVTVSGLFFELRLVFDCHNDTA